MDEELLARWNLEPGIVQGDRSRHVCTDREVAYKPNVTTDLESTIFLQSQCSNRDALKMIEIAQNNKALIQANYGLNHSLSILVKHVAL